MHNVWWYNVTCLEGGETKETDQDHRRHGQEEPVGWGSSQHVGVDFFLLLLLQQSDWWRWPDLAFCLLPISKSKCRQRNNNNNNQQQQRLEIWALLNILECVEQKMSSSQRRRRNQLIQSSQSLNLVCVHTKPSLNLYLYTTTIPPLGGFYSFFPYRCWLVDLIVYTVPLLLLLPGHANKQKHTEGERAGLASGRARAFPIAGFCRIAIKVGPPQQQKEAELNLKTLLLAPCAGFVLFFHVVPDMRGVTNQRKEVLFCPVYLPGYSILQCCVHVCIACYGHCPPPFCYIGHAALSVL